MSSSTTTAANNDYGPPAKKIRIAEPRPEAEFKVDDVAVVKMMTDTGSGRWQSVVIKVTTVEWDNEHGAWFYNGEVWGTEISVRAPESHVRKAIYAPGQEVNFDKGGVEVCGNIKLIWFEEDHDTSEVTYEVTTSFEVAEDDLWL